MSDSNSTSNGAPAFDLQIKPKLARLFRLQYEEVQQGYVLLYPEGMVKLNQSAGEILKRCDGVRDVAAIIADIEQTFNATGLEKDVTGFLQFATERGWTA